MLNWVDARDDPFFSVVLLRTAKNNLHVTMK